MQTIVLETRISFDIETYLCFIYDRMRKEKDFNWKERCIMKENYNDKSYNAYNDNKSQNSTKNNSKNNSKNASKNNYSDKTENKSNYNKEY